MKSQHNLKPHIQSHLTEIFEDSPESLTERRQKYVRASKNQSRYNTSLVITGVTTADWAASSLQAPAQARAPRRGRWQARGARCTAGSTRRHSPRSTAARSGTLRSPSRILHEQIILE